MICINAPPFIIAFEEENTFPSPGPKALQIELWFSSTVVIDMLSRRKTVLSSR